MSETVFTALGKVIEELDPAIKNNENPHFKNKFADLNIILSMIKPLCYKHKITLTQLPVTETVSNAGSPVLCLIGVTTVLSHPESDTALESTCVLPCQGLDPQKAGSALTYAKRYALKAMFCMQDADDDGQAAVKPPKTKATGLDFDTVVKLIPGCDTDAPLNDLYSTHIKTNDNLTAAQKNTLTAQCKTRKAAFK